MTQGLRLEVTHGMCAQGKLHYSLDGSVTALCGATMDAESCTRHESMLLPGSPDSKVCRECAGKVLKRAEEMSAVPTGGSVAAPGHEEALADLSAALKRSRQKCKQLQTALKYATANDYDLCEHDCCPKQSGRALGRSCDTCDALLADHDKKAGCWYRHYVAKVKARGAQ